MRTKLLLLVVAALFVGTGLNLRGAERMRPHCPHPRRDIIQQATFCGPRVTAPGCSSGPTWAWIIRRGMIKAWNIPKRRTKEDRR